MLSVKDYHPRFLWVGHLICALIFSLCMLGDVYASVDISTDTTYLRVQDLRTQAKQAHEQGHDLQTFRLYMQAMKSLERETDNAAYLNYTYELQCEMLSLTDGFLNQYNNAASRLLMLRFLMPLYDKTIATAYSLYVVSKGDTAYFDQAFLLSEKSRNIMLAEAIRGAGLKRFRSVPQVFLEKQRQLNASIFIYRNFLDNETANLSDTLKLKMYADSLHFFQQQADSLNFYFSKQYPAYYQLIHRSEFVSAGEISKAMQAGSRALLKYYCTDNNIYLFVCGPNGRTMYQIAKDTMLDENIERLQQSLMNGHATEFVAASNALYQTLFLPAMPQLQHCDHIRIITDASLANIPFECLVASKPLASQGFKTYDYLLHHFCISYAPSATMAFEKNDNSTAPEQSGLIGFAPVFSQQMKNTVIGNAGPMRDSVWLNLPEQRWSLRLAEEVSKNFQSRWYTDTAATASRFRELAGNYQVIHIASHTLIDEQNPMNARLVFARDPYDTATTASYICASDLYGMNLNASLAVLGACATGQGRTSKGEGMISLAYAFNYAGCSSLVYSLWSVDEKETSALMLAFYEGLQKGLDKDDALHQAKLKMLEEGNEITANPYYWAGFIFSGDVAPVEDLDQAYSFPWYMFVAPFTFLVLLPIYLRKRRQKN